MAMYLVSILALSLYVVLTLKVSYKGAAFFMLRIVGRESHID